MNNKIYLLTAIMAFASVGAMLLQPTLASAATHGTHHKNAFTNNSGSNDASNANAFTNANGNFAANVDSNSSNIPSASLSCGQVIKQSVKLSDNLDCTSDGLIVGADGITIDLNGHTLNGPGPQSSKIGIMLATSS